MMSRLGRPFTVLVMIAAVGAAGAAGYILLSMAQEARTHTAQAESVRVRSAAAAGDERNRMVLDRPDRASSVLEASTDEKEKKEKNLGYFLDASNEATEVTEAQALALAEQQLGESDKPLSEPKASKWRATKKKYRRDDEQVVEEHLDLNERPVWVVTYDAVETVAPTPKGSPLSPNYTGRFDIMIDASTGQWYTTGVVEK